MDRLFDYFTNHPFLAGAAMALLAAVIAWELRQRAAGSGAVTPVEAIRLMNQGAVLVDVRTANQFKDGHIEGARNVPGDQLADGPKPLERFAGKTVILCCDAGTTSAAALRTAQRGGLKNVVLLRGGLSGWRQENLPVVRG